MSSMTEEQVENRYNEWWAELSWRQKDLVYRLLRDWDMQFSYKVPEPQEEKRELLELALRLRRIASAQSQTVFTLLKLIETLKLDSVSEGLTTGLIEKLEAAHHSLNCPTHEGGSCNCPVDHTPEVHIKTNLEVRDWP